MSLNEPWTNPWFCMWCFCVHRLFLLSVLTIHPVGLSLNIFLEAFPSPRVWVTCPSYVLTQHHLFIVVLVFTVQCSDCLHICLPLLVHELSKHRNHGSQDMKAPVPGIWKAFSKYLLTKSGRKVQAQTCIAISIRPKTKPKWNLLRCGDLSRKRELPYSLWSCRWSPDQPVWEPLGHPGMVLAYGLGWEPERDTTSCSSWERGWQGLGEGLEMRKWHQPVISRDGGNGYCR